MNKLEQAVLDAVKKLQEVEAAKYFHYALLVDGQILWPIDVKEQIYLSVDLEKSLVHYVLYPQMSVSKKPVSLADLWISARAMNAFAELARERNELGLEVDIQVGEPDDDGETVITQFHHELDFNRQFATVYYLQRAFELGAERLKLQKTKIVDDRMFFPVYDEGKTYLVYAINAAGDDVDLFVASAPTLEACEPKMGILVATPKNVLGELKRWVEEAGG